MNGTTGHTEMQILDSGDSCLLIMLGNEISPSMHKKVRRLYHKLNEYMISGVREVVPAYRSVSVFYDPMKISGKTLRDWIHKTAENTAASEDSGEATRHIRIPVCFGGEMGPDLGRVAEYHDMEEDEVIRRFCEPEYLNYFLGFMPGKPYLGGLPKDLETPRMDVPRLKVPAGTIALFGKQAGIFGIEQPSGCNCMGRTPVRIYDIRKEQPVLLKMGDMIQFYPISREEYDRINLQVENMTYQEELLLSGGGGNV